MWNIRLMIQSAFLDKFNRSITPCWLKIQTLVLIGMHYNSSSNTNQVILQLSIKECESKQISLLNVFCCSQQENLPSPWGTCDQKDFQYYSSNVSYTKARCQLECSTNVLQDRCGCKQPHMPGSWSVHIDPKVFTSWQSSNNVNTLLANSRDCIQELRR